jgi:hypothetical protein
MPLVPNAPSIASEIVGEKVYGNKRTVEEVLINSTVDKARDLSYRYNNSSQVINN